MERVLVPELLDGLPSESVRAEAARKDLRRLNVVMGHRRILCRTLSRYCARNLPGRIVELGSGDGSLLLSVARDLTRARKNIEAVLVDRTPAVPASVLGQFRALGWAVRVDRRDAIEWLAQPGPSVDVLLANLFLHHFKGPDLAQLLRLGSHRAQLFVALEPRRSPLCLLFSRMVGLIGCNDVTRHDAPASVKAGFAGTELSALWPGGEGWRLEEQPSGPFSHLFVAQKV